MSQLATLQPPPRPLSAAPMGDSPDVLFIMRHYRWMLIIGTLLGVLVGLSSFWVARRFFPSYAAWVEYQVLPTQAGPLDKVVETFQGDEITRFIARQRNVLKLNPSESLLEDMLKDDAFRFDYNDKSKPDAAKRKSPFLLRNDSPKTALKNNLDVVPIPNTDLYHVQFTGPDPQEIWEQVTACAKVYENFLRNRTTSEEAEKLKQLKATRAELQQRVDVAQQTVETFRDAHDIPGIIQSNSRLTAALASLDTAVVKAQTDTNQARGGFESIKKQLDSNTFKLPADMQAQVDNDMQAAGLQAEKRALEREREVMLNDHGPAYAAIKALDIRIAACQKQADGLREEAAARARISMVEQAQRFFTGAQAVEQDLLARRNELLIQVKDLEHWLNEFSTRTDNLKQQQALLQELDQKILMIEVARNSDASRIRKYGESGVPDKSDPVFPLWWKFVLPSVLAGAFAAFGLSYLRELTNTRVRTPRDITRTMQMPLLGFVPDQEDDTIVNGDLMTSIRTSPNSMIAESFRQIRGRLAAQADGSALGTMLVASIAPGGGATTVASNLANGIALNDVRVLLVDANFYRPGLSSIYRNIPALGLSDVIAGKAKVEDVIVESAELPTLHLMGTGSKPNTTSAELLESRAFREALSVLKSRYDLVIFDGAPLSLVSDSLSLAAKLDGVVAVVRAGSISRGTVTRVRDQLRQVRANLLGLVLNAAQTHGAGYFKQNYRSFYQYAAPSQMPRKPAEALGR